MGKGTIISHDGAALYTIVKDYDQAAATAKYDALQAEKDILDVETLPALADQVAAAEIVVASVVTDTNIAIATYAADRTPENLNFVVQWIAFLAEKGKILGDLNKEQAGAMARGKAIADAMQFILDTRWDDETVQAWCVDLSDGLEGTEMTADAVIGTIELNGQEIEQVVIQPNYAELASYDTVRDGRVSDAISQTDKQLFYNMAIKPGWHQWWALYSACTIMVIDRDALTCTVKSDLITVGVTNDINVGGSLFEGITFSYMYCADTYPFVVGDKVVVEFTAHFPYVGQVIGFVSNPRICNAGDIICTVLDDSCLTGYGDPVLPPATPGTCGGANDNKRVYRSTPDGAWQLEHSLDFAFGNVDWRGVGTETLTWTGPNTRHGEPNWPDIYIYRGGSIFASIRGKRAIKYMVGAAIIKDDADTSFLIAVCFNYTASPDDFFDTVFIKNMTATGATDPGAYDVATNPNGWLEIGEFGASLWSDATWNTENTWGEWRAHHWMFNERGDEAGNIRTVRKKTIQEKNSPGALQFHVLLEDTEFTHQYACERFRLNITHGTGIGSFSAEMINVPDDHMVIETTVDSANPLDCGTLIYHRSTATISGKFPYAVDYKGNQEVVCYLNADCTDTEYHDRLGQWNPVTEECDNFHYDTSFDSTGSVWFSVNGFEFTMHTNTHSDSVSSGGDQEFTISSMTNTLMRSDLVYMDLRAGAFRKVEKHTTLYIELYLIDNIRVWADEFEKRWVFIHDGIETEYKVENTSNPVNLTDIPFLERLYAYTFGWHRLFYGGLTYTYPANWYDYGYNKSIWHFPVVEPPVADDWYEAKVWWSFNMEMDFTNGISYSGLEGKYDATTANGDYAFSQLFADGSSYNYLSGGDLVTLTGVPGTNPRFYPIGVV